MFIHRGFALYRKMFGELAAKSTSRLPNAAWGDANWAYPPGMFAILRPMTMVGHWTLEADGRRCTDIRLPAFGTEIRQCGYTYRLGKEIFFTRSDVDRNATVLAYTGPAFLR